VSVQDVTSTEKEPTLTGKELAVVVTGEPGPAAATDEPAAVTAGGAPGRGKAFLAALLPPGLVFVAFIGLWYLVSYELLDPDQREILVPPLHEVLQVGFFNHDNLVELLGGLWQTTMVAFVGLLIAVALGLATAVAMSQARWVERSLFPYAVVLQCIPILALVPLIGFWLDFGFSARVVVCVLISLFPIITNTLFGLQSVEPGQQDLFTLHGASRWTRLTKLQFPAALPAVFTGLRISAGLSVVGAVVGDLFFKQGENPGIGSLIGLYLNRLLQQQLFAAIILSSALGVVVFWLFGFLGQRAVGSWHVTSSRDGR